MATFQNYISWKTSLANPPKLSNIQHITRNILSLPKFPSQPNKSISLIERQHAAPGFSSSLKDYLNRLMPNPISSRMALTSTLPFQRVDIYHTLKFCPPNLEENEEEQDVLKASPALKQKPGRFDTAVVLHKDEAESTGLEG
jgi:hypothetical protein